MTYDCQRNDMFKQTNNGETHLMHIAVYLSYMTVVLIKVEKES